MLKNIVAKATLISAGITLSLATIAVKPAQATNFFLGGFPDRSSSFNYSEDNIDLTVTGGTLFAPRDVVRRPLGLGVRGGILDDPEIDGFGPDEAIFFNFNKKVSLISATFSRVGFDDDFQLFVDGDFLVSDDIPGGNFSDFGIGTFNFKKFAPNNQGSSFTFTVADNSDDYFLKKVKVKAVPEPATLLGLLAVGSLGTTGVLKRKKCNQA